MRTCPNCGKDTRAETTQPCSRCGFSPGVPDDASFDVSGGSVNFPQAERVETTYGGEQPQDSSAPEPGFGLPDEPPPAPQGTQRRNPPWLLLFIVLVLVAQGLARAAGCEAPSDASEQAAQPLREQLLVKSTPSSTQRSLRLPPKRKSWSEPPLRWSRPFSP